MSVATLPSEPFNDGSPEHQRGATFARADGRVELRFARREEGTRLSHLFQSDPCRALFPRPERGEPPLAVIATTSGGVVGGDRLSFSIHAGRRTSCTVITQAAEKVYRSDGAESEISIRVRAGADASCEWMPQETILFDRARLRRTTDVELGPRTRLIAGEMVVFGRGAYGERVRDGLLLDRWTVRRKGRLIWADSLLLDGEVADALAHPASFGGAGAIAMLICSTDDARRWLAPTRALLGNAEADGVRAGASCFDELLLVRLLAGDPAALRSRLALLWAGLRAEALGRAAQVPRIWTI